MSHAIASARKKAEKALAKSVSRLTPGKRSLEGAAAASSSTSSSSSDRQDAATQNYQLHPANGLEWEGGEDDDASHVPEKDDVYLAFLHDGQAAGIAYYSTADGSINTTSVHCPAMDVQWIISVMREQITSPVMIVTTSHISEAARQELGKKVDGNEVFEEAIPVKVVKHATFSLDISQSLLRAVCGAGHQAQLGSFLDLNDPVQLRAAGGLLHWLLKSGIISELDASAGGRAVLPGGLHMFSLADMMQIDALTFSALSIFAKESHPALSGGGRAKEGFSLNALLDRTVSSPGKRQLRSWCLQPSLDMEVIRHRHDAVGFLMAARAQAPELWKELKGYIKKVKDLTRLLVRIKSVKAGPADWFGLAQTILASNMIKDHLHLLLMHVKVTEDGAPASRSGNIRASTSSTHGGHGGWPSGAGAGGAHELAEDPLASTTPYSTQAPFLLRQVLHEFSGDLVFLQTTLDSVIDWEGSRESGVRGRLAIMAGLDFRLDEYRRTYADLPAFLSNVSLEELESYPSLATLTMKYLPQIGVVVEVDKVDNGLVATTADAATAPQPAGAGAPTLVPMAHSERAASVIPPDFELCYETGGELLFKTPRARELDDYFGDIAAVIADLEASIVRQLEEKVLEYEPLLLTVAQRLAELDVLLSFAEVSQDYRYVRPQLHSEPVLLVKGARHPLQELTVDTFVPNDIAMAPGHPSAGGAVSIITGPNFSGKSVYLKTIGLIPYMSQIGCFVPAERALVGMVDRIFTCVHSLESASLAHQSTFTIDLNQVGLMLRHATPRSLLLIDEFGKGTSSIDGVSLLAATIRSLLAGATLPSLMRDVSGALTSASDTGGIGAARIPPKTVITTHFREVFDFDLLGLGSDADGRGLASGQHSDAAASSSNSSSSSSMSAPALPPLPPGARTELSFYQMQVVLDKQAQAAALSGATALAGSVAQPTMGGDDGGGVDDGRSDAGGGPSYPPEEGDDVVVPLFRLVQGRADSSYGLDCARKGGIPRAVVDRARAVTHSLMQSGSVAPAPCPPPVALARLQREQAVLDLAAVLVSVPDWQAASPDQLVAALRALRVVAA